MENIAAARPLSPVKVFMQMRAKLIERGLRCPIAETYAKDAVVRFTRALTLGLDPSPAFSDERADYYRDLHKGCAVAPIESVAP